MKNDEYYVFFPGMNDYASIILYVMRDESLAYICFCSIMKHIRANFATDGVAMATKFHHLKVLLQAIDPVYWNFLESCDAGIINYHHLRKIYSLIFLSS